MPRMMKRDLKKVNILKTLLRFKPLDDAL